MTPSEANQNVGQGGAYGVGRATFDDNTQGMYTGPKQEPFDQSAAYISNNGTEEQSPLPIGWSEHFDNSSGHYYYYNSADGTTTWDRPVSTNQETLHGNEVGSSVEGGEARTRSFTDMSESKNERLSQVHQKIEDASLGHHSWDSQQNPQGQSVEENSEPASHPTNGESQDGDSLLLNNQANEEGDGYEWNHPRGVAEQVDNRELLRLSNGPKDSASVHPTAEQNIAQTPGVTHSGSQASIPSEERKNTDVSRGNGFSNGGGLGRESPPQQPQIGGWGLPRQGSDEFRQDSMPQPHSRGNGLSNGGDPVRESPPQQSLGGWGLPHQGPDEHQDPPPQSHSLAFDHRAYGSDNAPQYSGSEKVSPGVQEPQQTDSQAHVRSPGEIPHDRNRIVHPDRQRPPDRPNQGSAADQGQQVGGSNTPSNGQSVSQFQQPSNGNGDPRFNTQPRSHPPNSPYGPPAEGTRPPLPHLQPRNLQHPPQSSSSMPPQSQHPASQYQQELGNYQRPVHYGNHIPKQQPAYYGQPSADTKMTSVLEDGTVVVKDALEKSWSGLVGFGSRTREYMGQARDQVVTGASVAGQSISEKSTSWWGQAKSALGSVFEKSDDATPSEYNMSNRYGGQPPQRYSEGQNMQNHQRQNPNSNTLSPPARRYVPNTRPYEQKPTQPPLDQHQRYFQGQQYQRANGQNRGPRPQPKYDPPLPQGQGRPPNQPYQNQYRNPPRHPSYPDQRGESPPRQAKQGQHPDPWSHPGLSGDM